MFFWMISHAAATHERSFVEGNGRSRGLVGISLMNSKESFRLRDNAPLLRPSRILVLKGSTCVRTYLFVSRE